MLDLQCVETLGAERGDQVQQLSPFVPGPVAEAPGVAQLRTEVTQVWDAYQASRYGYVVARLPQTLAAGQAATQTHEGEDQEQSFALLALTYQATAVLLTKLGEADLAWIAAERGFTAAQRCGDVVVIGSLFRSVTHTLLSTGRFREAKQLTADAAAYMQPGLAEATPEYLSVYGTLFLATVADHLADACRTSADGGHSRLPACDPSADVRRSSAR
ncbi:hypothetical protein [Micromonospora sp. DT41]|uniref:hypothetical protein n=1 Tax=Micromonospora sp. DT41 TaxID=3393437 RepID=UPI003CF05E25